MTCRLSIRDFLRLGLLMLTGGFVWVSVNGLWSSANWQSPASYSVDALETLARFKFSAEKGAALPFDPTVERLGAPWVADWSAYPMPDAPWYWLVGLMVRWLGLIPASHLAMGMAHLAAIAAFFLSARLLGHRPLVAAGAAVLFGFSYYICYRGLSHHSFALIFTVPPTLLLAALVARSRRLIDRPAVRVVSVGFAALAGTGSPYFIFLFSQLLGWALLWQVATLRRGSNVLTGLGCFAVCGVMFVAANFPALRAAAEADGHAFTRGAGEASIYALRLPQLVTPPPNHRWSTAAEIGRERERQAAGQSELFSPYLGVAGLSGLAVMLLGTLGSAPRFFRRGWKPGYVTVALWILAFALAGGINTWLAQAGLTVFRAGNRYSIHLLALSLFCLSAWGSRRLTGRGHWLGWILVLPFTAIGLWDQVPAGPGEVTRTDLHRAAAGDRQSAATLEGLLPRGALIFQLPVAPFPEAGPRGGMPDYEHLRPYLHSGSLRFSYGLLRGSPELRWSQRMSESPASALPARLAEAGFGAVWIDRRAYTNNAAALTETFRSAGLREIVLPESPHICVYMLPAADRLSLPDPAEFRWHEPWGGADPARDVTLHAVSGWFGTETSNGRHWRWAGREAALGIWNGTTQTRAARLTFQTVTVGPGVLEIHRAGAVIARWEVTSGPSVTRALELQLPPGSTPLDFKFTGNLVEPATDPRRLGFSLENVALELR